MFGVISVVAFREIMQGHLEAVGIEQERRNALDFFSAHFLADQLTLFQSKGCRLCPLTDNGDTMAKSAIICGPNLNPKPK